MAVKKLKWILKAEKINAVMLRVIEMALVENLINNGSSPEQVLKEGISLGKSMGDLVFIALHTRFDIVLREALELPRFLENLYVFLFGERPSKVELQELSGEEVVIRIEDRDGFPTCRGIVSPHQKIKFGFYLVGIIDRIFEILKDELGLSEWIVKEDKCTSVGDESCLISINLKFKREEV